MTGETIILRGPRQREHAKRLIDAAPPDCVVTIKEATRNLDQNAKMWAMLTDVAVQCELDGRKFTRDDWKCIFMRACGWEVQFLPGIGDLKPFPTGFGSSRLTVPQMAKLITYISAYGDEREVVWSEPHPDERATA